MRYAWNVVSFCPFFFFSMRLRFFFVYFILIVSLNKQVLVLCDPLLCDRCPVWCAVLAVSRMLCVVETHQRVMVSQGPLPHTVADFWRMTVECEVQVIVMACNQTEAGKVSSWLCPGICWFRVHARWKLFQDPMLRTYLTLGSYEIIELTLSCLDKSTRITCWRKKAIEMHQCTEFITITASQCTMDATPNRVLR